MIWWLSLIDKRILKKLQKIATCANVCNFEKKGPLQLFFLCIFVLKVAVDSNQACLICATEILYTFQKVAKVKWLSYKLQRF